MVLLVQNSKCSDYMYAVMEKTTIVLENNFTGILHLLVTSIDAFCQCLETVFQLS